MKTTITYLKTLSLVLLLLFSLGLSAQEIGGTFDARMEEKLGLSELSSQEWLYTKSTTWTPLAGTYAASYRGAAANFLAEENNTKVAVYFTAEARGTDMEIRAVVDGAVMAPGAITFSTHHIRESRAFIFTGTFDKGIHSLRIEWRSLKSGQGVFIRDASLLIRKDNQQNAGEMAAKSIIGQSIVNSNNWVDIPNSIQHVSAQNGDVLTASVALEMNVAAGHSLYMRALVNGVPSAPTDVLFARGNRFQAKTMTFGFAGVAAGRKSVKFQWKVSPNGSAVVQGRSFVASTMPSDPTNCEPHMKFKAANSGPNVSTSSYFYSPIPDMNMNVSIPENGEIAVIFSAETSIEHNKELFVRMRVGNKIIDASEVSFAKGDQFAGVHSFVFVVKHIHAKGFAAVENIQLEWRLGNAAGSTAYMGDRTMAVIVEKGGTPDLAEPPQIGSVAHPLGGQGGIEPVQGTVPLLAIMIDPERSGHSAPEIDSLDKRLFGSFSAQDYYNKVSGGRFNLSKVDILSFTADLTDEYWTHHTCDSTQDTVCLTKDCIQEGYSGGHSRRWAEALDKANASGFDFAQYDKNKDGILDPRELAILIITPQAKESGSVRALNPYCPTNSNPDGRYVVDGVRIIAIAEWYTRAKTARTMVTPTHELAHLLFNLGDLYNTDKDIATEAGFFDIMGEVSDNGSRVPHFQGRTKLALGWSTPRFVMQSGTITIEDVRTSEDVFILPRNRNVDGREFFLLENRGTMGNNPGYDAGIYGEGIAVWHIIESPGEYYFTPKAVTCLGNWGDVDGGKARRTSRLIRPTVNLTDEANSLWNASTGYDLLSSGFSCGNPKRNALIWADNIASGYSIRNWPAYSSSMNVDVTVPRTYAPNCPDDTDPLDVTVGGDKAIYQGLTSTNGVMLTANVQGCQGPYSYQWSTGERTQSIWVNPRSTFTYSVTVSSQSRSQCVTTESVVVTVEDVRCGRQLNKVAMCHNGNALCVSPSAAQALMNAGAVPGSCQTSGRRDAFGEDQADLQSEIQAYPNPFNEKVNFSFTMLKDTQVKLEIFNLQGQRVATVFEGRVGAGEKQEANWRPGDGLATGLYLYRLASESGEILQGKLNWIQ